jgi:hypothetical protein
MEELNPHLPFGDNLLGIFRKTKTIRFYEFSIVYTIDEGVQKNILIFNSDLKGVFKKK